MATCSFDREYVLADTPENRALWEKLSTPSQKPPERESITREILERIDRLTNEEEE